MNNDVAQQLSEQAIDLKEQSQFDGSIAMYQQVIDLEPDCHVPYYNLGLLYKHYCHLGLTLIPMILLLTACHKPSRRNNEITKIELAYNGGSRISNGSALSIDSSLSYQYFGEKNTQKAGFYSGVITQGFWDTLNMKFEHIGYKTSDATEQSDIPDAGYFELFIHWNGGTTHLFCRKGANKNSLLKELQWLQNSYKAIKLHSIKDSIRFNTKLQNPPPMPSMVKDLKFIPYPTEKVLAH